MTYERNQTILIVDDTPTNLDVLANALINAGYQVAVALDGETALTQIDYKPPQLILLDVMMPGIDGFETCRRLKSNPKVWNIPIIFMTALSEAVNKSKGFSLGAVDYVTKPFEVEEVLARVNTHLKLYQLTTSLEEEVTNKTAELTVALEQLQSTQIQMMYGERMSLVGELSAGLAYEISNPINFISGNLGHVNNYFNQLLEFVDYYRETDLSHRSLSSQNSSQKIDQKFAESKLPTDSQLASNFDLDDLDFIRRDLPKILVSFQRGANKIQTLVSTLRSFSNSDQFGRKQESVNALLDNCLTLISHKLQHKTRSKTIRVIRSYQEDIPLIECYPAALSQSLMGIILVYITALEASFKEDALNQSSDILIKTECDSLGSVFIHISVCLDNIFSRDQLNKDALNFAPISLSNIPLDENLNERNTNSYDMSLLIANDVVVQKHGGCLRTIVQSGQTEVIFELKQILAEKSIASSGTIEPLEG
ncbi:MAG: response regulator [Symploca sp. SIO2B6]|nr:response regulator [Symploca sp. SIO2B6]